MNDGDDILSLLTYTTLASATIEDNALSESNTWQTSAESKDEMSASTTVPVVALDDGRFVLQNSDGQFYLLTMSSADANEEILPQFSTDFSVDNAVTFEESEAVTNTIIVNEGPPKKAIEIPDSPSDEEGEEKFLFLCAQCTEVFCSVEACRDHMIKDHNMVISNDVPKVLNENTEEQSQLPLQPIDTNSKTDNTEKPAANTNKEKESGEKDGDQENSSSNSVKSAKSATAGEKEREKEKVDKGGEAGDKEQSIAKMKSKRKKMQSDPDYDLRPFKCKHVSCVQRFRSQESLTLHLACHQAPNRREYACSQAGCSQKYDDWRHTAMHLWQAHQIDVDLYTCSICDKHKASSRVALETHMRIHDERREFACPDCGKAFKQKAQLRNHRVTHMKKAGEAAPRWYMSKQCDICLKTYADSKCLKKHVQAVHSKLRPYLCQVCGHSAARKAMLQAHLRQHTGEKPYACNSCDFKTGDHNSLRRHQMRHSGVRPYKCPHCSYASIQSTSFKNHVQVRHPDKECGIYQCGRCNFRTVSQPAYLQHQSDHNNNLIPTTGEDKSSRRNDVQVFPENVAAAQLIYHCMSGGSGAGGKGKGGSQSPRTLGKADVTASSTSGDGTKQTITIEISTNGGGTPVSTDDEDTTHVVDAGGITIPADPPNST
ncbi:zinc finger protein 485 [Nilaparvata lugens]|uniref:zinc finger protein 485 n=1 Tax=Nilaparvata lugens TaxID=108931 RepID=UPI00193E8EB5|nr:zinc finger protein 485 [Nilaparvata lugens]